MKCDKCGSYVSIEEHHIHPKFMSNPDGKGLKSWLCQNCHHQLHLSIISPLVFAHVPDFGDYIKSWQNKQQCIEAIKRRTEEWIKEKEF